jgi:hypothetical protein
MSAVAKDAVAEALRRAEAFLAGRGAAREARYVAAVAGLAGPREIEAEAAAGQEAHGALPGLVRGDAPGPGVASTADALGWLVALGVTEGNVVEGALAYLTAQQGADGAWSDAEAQEEGGALALSAGLCGILARCPAARLSVLRRAAAYLAAHWSEERVRAGSYPEIAGYLHAFASVPADLDVADEALQWCGRELERGFRIGAFDALQVARVFVLCDSAALPGARLQAAEVLEALLRAQVPDGSFAGRGTPERSTCEAALALRHLGRCLR